MPRPSKAMIAAYREMDRELAEGRSAEVVVSRTDLEWAVGMIEDEWTGERGMLLHPDHDPIYARLRAVLNTENQT